MDLPNLKELKAILRLCRDQGVTDIKFGTFDIKFGELPQSNQESVPEDAANPHGLTDEQLLFYSVDPLQDRAEQ